MLVVRSLAFNLFLYVFTAICSVIAMLVAILWPSRLAEVAQRWSQAWLYAYRLICGVSLSVRGVEHMPQGPCIIAMKHQSTWDTFALFAIFNRPVFVLKSELMWVPVFGWVLKRLGCIAVKRGTGRYAVESMIQGAQTAVARGNHIVVFPEGTRSTVGVPSDYKSGVSHLYRALGVACVPVGLNSGLFWPRRSILRPPGRIIVEILPPIPPGLPRREMFERMVGDIETTSQRLNSEALQRDVG
jgi:1-acyl-sn-glycerol-3-phosphate acyltransferase